MARIVGVQSCVFCCVDHQNFLEFLVKVQTWVPSPLNKPESLGPGSGICMSKKLYTWVLWVPRWLSVKNLPANAGDAGDTGLIPKWGRSPGQGNGNPHQHSWLGNPVDRGAWWATVHGSQRVERTEAPWHTRTVLFNLETLCFGLAT